MRHRFSSIVILLAASLSISAEAPYIPTDFSGPCGSFLLNCHRSICCVDDRSEFDDRSIARQLDDMAMVLRKKRVNYLATQSFYSD